MLASLSLVPGLARGSRSLFGAAAAAVLAVALLVCTSSAQSDDDASGGGASSVDAACMQRCFDEYIAALELCEATCSECVQWLGPICLLRVLNQQCFNACSTQAKAALRTCQADC
jgi:hypothetical protein